jgi:hypothetical protein
MNLPIDILLNIYTYVGNETLFLDKYLYYSITEKRKEFMKKPILLYYNLVQWKYAGLTNMKIINRLEKDSRPSMSVGCVCKCFINNVPLGTVLENGTIYPSIELEKYLIPEMLIENDNSIYINPRIKTWNIYSMKAYRVERAKRYSNLWITNGKNRKVLNSRRIDEKINKDKNKL